MSYNPNFYSNYYPPHQNTFQRPEFVPPPPPPPTFFIPPPAPAPFTDQDYVKKYDSLPQKSPKHKPQKIPINMLKEKLRKMLLSINTLKEKEKYLKDNLNKTPDTEWNALLSEIEDEKTIINNTMSTLNDSYLDLLRKALAKRSSKRLRQRRVRQEHKQEKLKRIKEMEEKSRKIDESLQKIQDDILKAKKEEEAKLEADIVLKEVLRKKHDAKKCLTKLDALLRLYRARQNTAKGRGEQISERDCESFSGNIEKLKALWNKKLQQYEREETELRSTLKRHEEQGDGGRRESDFLDNLQKWRKFMFGTDSPQFDFKGDVGRFVAIRSQWDQYINTAGTALPVGWVLPDFSNDE